MKRNRLAGVAVEQGVLPRDLQRVRRRDVVPQLRLAVGSWQLAASVEQMPIRLRHDAKRRHQRGEPAVGGYRVVRKPHHWLDLAKGVDAQMRDVVRGDLERPVREGCVNPVGCRAESPPVGCHGRICRKREVKPLVSADARHDKSALDVFGRQHSGGVRRTGRIDAGNAGLRRASVPAGLDTAVEEHRQKKRTQKNALDFRPARKHFRQAAERMNAVLAAHDGQPCANTQPREANRNDCRELQRHWITSAL